MILKEMGDVDAKRVAEDLSCEVATSYERWREVGRKNSQERKERMSRGRSGKGEGDNHEEEEAGDEEITRARQKRGMQLKDIARDMRLNHETQRPDRIKKDEAKQRVAQMEEEDVDMFKSETMERMWGAGGSEDE